MRTSTRRRTVRRVLTAVALTLSAVTVVSLHAASPAGAVGIPTRAYVTHGSNSVIPIDTATNTAGTNITVGNVPLGIAITPNGKTAYVANQSSGTVTPIDTATNTAGTNITTGAGAFAIAITLTARPPT